MIRQLFPALLICSLLVSYPAATAQETPAEIPDFLVEVLKNDGSPLLDKEKEKIKITVTGDGKNKNRYRIESPLLKSGEVSVGFQFTKEQHLPAAKVTEKSVSFNDKKKTTVTWSKDAKFVAPKPKKKLNIMLAEYGADGKWMDITALVKKSQIGDSLAFRITNTAVGKDPVPGVVKSMMLTYSLIDKDDEEEFLKEYTENALVRVQFNEKEQYFRFVVKDTDVFEFNVITQ
ncbi:MAG: hypothetical protein FWE67_11100 [Planctomycetaceae bacterium]|nr:hypothetical protein [Planctomycetaceae bacterium]